MYRLFRDKFNSEFENATVPLQIAGASGDYQHCLREGDLVPAANSIPCHKGITNGADIVDAEDIGAEFCQCQRDADRASGVFFDRSAKDF